MLITETVLGAPCWFELSSTDPGASKAFYAAVFGWSSEDIDMGEMGIYCSLKNANGTVAALWQMPAEQQAAGVPSYWGVYFQVADADASTAAALADGAELLVPVMEVGGHGRMAVLRDPTGAVFNLWQSTSSGGGQMAMFEDHAIGWVELATRDSARAADFYSKLLGWSLRGSDMPMPEDSSYTHYTIGETQYGGILQMNAMWEGIAPSWAIYVLVPDVDACLVQAIDAGGKVVVPAFDAAGVGRIAMIADPTGANCYVIHLDREP